MPEPNRPVHVEDSRPQAYWATFNEGVSQYRGQKYGRAKAEFVKLLDYPNPHQTALTYLMRTYRKLISQYMAEGDMASAYSAFGEFFHLCPGLVTATDGRKFQKVLAAISKQDPAFAPAFQAPQFSRIAPDFEVHASAGVSVLLTSNESIGKVGASRVGRWSFVQEVGHRTLFVKSFYNPQLSKYDRSVARVRGPDGDIEREFELDHGIYRLGSSSHNDSFVVSSDDMKLYLYSLSGNCLGQYDLRRFSDDKYHLRTIGVLPRNQHLVFTHVDKAGVLDARLELVDWWIMPPKEGWKRVAGGHLPPEYHRSLSVLGLSADASAEEIKRAWREQIFRHHPDRNPGDPLATDRARELNIAYEYLTGDDAQVALEAMRDMTYEQDPSNRIRMPIAGTNLVVEIGISIGSGEDWIYAQGIGAADDRLYLGCYSGMIYCLHMDGHVSTVYRCHDVPRGIREHDNLLYIETDSNLFIIKHAKCLRLVNKPPGSTLRWGQRGFMIQDSKTLKVYGVQGDSICNLAFKHSISDFYFTGAGLSVETASRLYSFIVD